MPLETLGRLLGLTRDPYDASFAEMGLRRAGGVWAGTVRKFPVRIERLNDGVRVRVDLPVPLQLDPPDRWPRTHDHRFDEAFSVPPEQQGSLSGRVRGHLVGLSGAGDLSAGPQGLVLERAGAASASDVCQWTQRMVRVADSLYDDLTTLAELAYLRDTDPQDALQLARRLRGRSRTAANVRVHADALVRRGRKLLRIVVGPSLPAQARCWAAERLPSRYVDDVVDELLDRPRTPGDLAVLATLARHHEVALLLAHHEAFWTVELAKADEERAGTLVSLVEALVREEPGPWLDALVPLLVGLSDPLLGATLRVVAQHGSHQAFIAVSAVLDQGVPWSVRSTWREAHATLRSRHRGSSGAVSLAVRTGDLAIPDD